MRPTYSVSVLCDLVAHFKTTHSAFTVSAVTYWLEPLIGNLFIPLFLNISRLRYPYDGGEKSVSYF